MIYVSERVLPLCWGVLMGLISSRRLKERQNSLILHGNDSENESN